MHFAQYMHVYMLNFFTVSMLVKEIPSCVLKKSLPLYTLAPDPAYDVISLSVFTYTRGSVCGGGGGLDRIKRLPWN
jgi:hypothetical protein